MSATDSLDRFIARYLDSVTPLPERFDAAWRSPCEIGEPFRDTQGVERIHWRPIRQSESDADPLAGLEHALETPLHGDIKRYYGRWWSANIDALAPDGPVSLILLWNPEDSERLLGNLIGHALAKRQQRAALTIFFATVGADADYFLSVDNATGEVLLEEPGNPPLRRVAPDLATFLDALAPTVRHGHEA